MAYEIPGFTMSVNSSEDMTAKQYFAVDYNSDQEIEISASGGACIGIVQNDPDEDQQATVMVSGISFCIFGATVTAGQLLMPSAGKLIPATTGRYAVARALVGGALNEQGCCLLTPGGYSI